MNRFYNYSRNFGKENLIKESISTWCATAKKGKKMIVVNPLGSYILGFKGKWKPTPSKISINGGKRKEVV